MPEQSQSENHDFFLAAVLRCHVALTQNVVPYGALLRRWKRRGASSQDFTPIYTLSWLGLLWIPFFLVPAANDSGWLVVALILAISLWRYLDLVLWYLGLLINPRHTRFAPVERNVLLFMLDLLTVVVIAGVLLRVTDSTSSASDAWFNAFFLTTLIDVPERADFWDGMVQVVIAAGGLLLIAGGLALILSVVSQRLVSGGAHLGPSHARPDD